MKKKHNYIVFVLSLFVAGLQFLLIAPADWFIACIVPASTLALCALYEVFLIEEEGFSRILSLPRKDKESD